MNRVRKSERGIVHCLAVCTGCDWYDDAYLSAAKAATEHVKETGHTVSVEQVVVYTLEAYTDKRQARRQPVRILVAM